MYEAEKSYITRRFVYIFQCYEYTRNWITSISIHKLHILVVVTGLVSCHPSVENEAKVRAMGEYCVLHAIHVITKESFITAILHYLYPPLRIQSFSQFFLVMLAILDPEFFSISPPILLSLNVFSSLIRSILFYLPSHSTKVLSSIPSYFLDVLSKYFFQVRCANLSDGFPVLRIQMVYYLSYRYHTAIYTIKIVILTSFVL